MGCGGSTEANAQDTEVGTPPTPPPQQPSQGDDHSVKDVAAGEIQQFAAQYLKTKKVEKEKDAAASDIQNSAHAFLEKKRAEKAAHAASASGEDKPFIAGLQAAQAAIGGLATQLSSRLFGGAESDADKASTQLASLKEEPARAPAADSVEDEKAAAAALIQKAAASYYANKVSA